MVFDVGSIGVDSLALIAGVFFFVAMFFLVYIRKPKNKVLTEGEIDIGNTIWVFAGEGNGVGYHSQGNVARVDSLTDSLKTVRLVDGTVLPHVKIDDISVAKSWNLVKKNEKILVFCRVDRNGLRRPWALPEGVRGKIQPSELYKKRIRRKIESDLLKGLTFREKLAGGEVPVGENYGHEVWKLKE